VVPLLVALLTLASPVAPPPLPVPPAEVITLRGGAWRGSAVVWDAAERRILTALHVVEAMPADAIEAFVPGRGAVPARVVDTAPELDLAVLEVAAELEAGPPLRGQEPMAGEPVLLPGCGAAGCAPGRGHVVAPSRAFAGSRYLAFTAAVGPGWSGGPVLDSRGALIGIVDLALLREPGTALAIPIDRAAARFPLGLRDR
jgi:S1-C subfamily serine protease